MAIKYRLKFQNFDLQNIVIEISSAKWTGAITDIVGVGGESYSKNIKFGDSNPYESHVGITNITARVYSNLIDVDELQLSNDKDWMITVYRNGSIDFKGFLIPDGIQRTRKGAGNAITLQATCGLALLSGKKINITPITDNVYGKITANSQECDNRAPIQYIRAILSHESMLANGLPIVWSTSVRCDEFPNDDFFAGRLSIFNGIYLKQITEFDNIDCLWLLYNLVKSGKGWLCQREGKWFIINEEDKIRLNGVLPTNEITEATGAQTAVVGSKDFNVNLDGKELHDDAMTWYKQAIGVADVSYNHVQQENIIPNGTFDYTTIGATPMDTVPLGWHFSNGLLPPSAPTITDRKGSAVELSFEHGQTGQDDYVFELINPLNIDGNVLYTDMQFGFTMMPMSGFPLSPDLGLIQWNQFPFRISVKYRAVKDGVEKDLYLNEFGFWSDENLDPNQKVDRFFTYDSGSFNAFQVEFNQTSSFYTGDQFEITIVKNGVTQSYVVVFTETMDVRSGIDYIATKVPNSNRMTSPFYALQVSGVDMSGNTAVMSKVDQYYKYILPEMPQAKLGDAITYQFSTKGNAGRILLPDTGSLYSKDATAGKLSIHFHVKAGQRYILDELWMNTNPNNDRYELIVDEANSREQFEMGISSSFSGFMLSSYMQNWGNANKTMNFSDYTASGKRLTELYGRGIMHWRSAPRMIYSGSFKVDSFEPFSLFTVGDKKYTPLTYDYNINKGQLTGLIGFEAKLDTPTIVVGHNVKKDGGSVSYGNNSGGDFNGVVNPNLQQVTDVGRTTTWDMTTKGTHNLEIHGIPLIEPSSGLMRTDIAYDWFDNNAPSGGGIPPTEWTISGASDADVASRQNGQVLYWDSISSKWKARDEQSLSGYATQAWVNSQGFATQSWVQGQGYLTQEVDTLASVAGRGSEYYGSITIGGEGVNSNSTKLFLRNAFGRTWALSSGVNEIAEGDFAIYDEPTGNTGSLKFLISGSTGNISIGGAVPETKLHVNGVITAIGGNSTQWNTAYTHSQTIGNPHNTQFSEILNKPSTLAGYGITNAYTKTESDARFKPIGYIPSWTEITGKPLIDVNPTANSIVQRDANGYIFANYINLPQTKTLLSDSDLTGVLGFGSSNDYVYQYSKQAVNQFLGMPANGDTLQSVLNRGKSAYGAYSRVMLSSDIDNSENNSIPVLGQSDYRLYLSNAGLYGMQFGITSSGTGFIQQGRTDGIATAYALLLNPKGGGVAIGKETVSSGVTLDVNGKITCPVIEPTASIVPVTAPSSPEVGKVYEYFTDSI